MSGDYSRQRFDPTRDFSGVLMQQGRVQLDSDWNELIAILDRRLRAETTDIIGKCVVPKETPGGFEIQISGGTLTIQRGRIYVDGLLAENHGKAPLEFDPVLAEQRGKLPVPYNEQPYLPNAAVVAPAPQSGGPHLVYIDVWRREVSYLEDAGLLEKAVGVDTTTRMQTVWQVKVLANVGAGATCGTPIQAWTDLIESSDGRLSTLAAGTSSSTDPCLIPPSGGYRGLENRLYRVEIHDGGTSGTATFKWSRDNASVATSVTAIPALDRLKVARVGRDSVLRFNVGDWIEVLDDWLEFARQPGINPQPPGVIAQIKNVDDATQTITLTSPLSGGVFPTDAQGNTDPERHTRIRRWDQSGQVRDTNGNLLVDLDAPGSNGVIPVPAAGTSIILEDGVQITFDTPAGGKYHIADAWTFAARTADASVETLQQAPPRAIHHHFCRLAVVTFPSTIDNCPDLWPPDFGGGGCECSVCVTVDSHNNGTLTIQRAIDQVKASGGTVCLGIGTYNLGENPIEISGAHSLRIRGQGYATALFYVGSGSAVLIENSAGVTLEDVAIYTAASQDTGSPAVALRNSISVILQHNIVFRAAERGIAAIGLGGMLVGTIVRENLILAPTGIDRLATSPKLDEAQPLLTAELFIEDNTLACMQRGINLGGLSVHVAQTRLAGNVILSCSEGAIAMTGWVMRGSALEVHGNQIYATGPGIIIGIDEARIDSNNISPLQAGKGGDGIVLTLGLDTTGINRCQLTGNRIHMMAGNGIHISGGIVNSAIIKNNFIEAVGGGGIVMNDASGGRQLVIENNQLINIARLANDPKTAVTGIRVVNTRLGEIVGNTINGVGTAAAQSPSRAGIQVINVDSARIEGNEVLFVGPLADFLQDTAAIDCAGTFARVDVINNTVRRSLTPPANLGTSRWYAVRIGSLPSYGFFGVGGELWFMVSGNVVYQVSADNVTEVPRGKEIVGVQGNLLEAYGSAPAVSVVAGGALTLSTNRCLLSTEGGQPVAQAQVGAVIANANYLEGTAKMVALTLQLPEAGPFTILGNITSGPIQITQGTAPPSDLQPPWAPLNVVAS